MRKKENTERCKCGNRLGHIAYTHCRKKPDGTLYCKDFYVVECWWCGRRTQQLIMDEDVEDEIVQIAMTTFDLRSIGITVKDLGGVVPRGN